MIASLTYIFCIFQDKKPCAWLHL